MRVLIVVPTYNERENLPTLVRALLQEPDYRVLVVDDESPDGTGAIADALGGEFGTRVRCLHRLGPRGLGRAYVEGFAAAVASDADVVCQMDADLSHDVRDLREMLAAAAGGIDLVIGSRYVRQCDTPGWPVRRRLLSRCANAYARAWSGLTQRDCTSGFRCWRREALADIDLTQIVSRGYAFQVEMLVAAVRRRFQIVEVPIVFRERSQGASKMSAEIIAESALMPWRMRGSTAHTETRRASRVPDGGAA